MVLAGGALSVGRQRQQLRRARMGSLKNEFPYLCSSPLVIDNFLPGLRQSSGNFLLWHLEEPLAPEPGLVCTGLLASSLCRALCW